MGSSSIEMANEKNALPIPEAPLSLPEKNKSCQHSLPNVVIIPESSVGDIARKVFVDLSTDQPLTFESLASDIGSRVYDLASDPKPEACIETAKKTAGQIAFAGLFSLSAVPLKHSLPILKGLPVQRMIETYQMIFSVAQAEKSARTSVALRETTSLALTGATVAMMTSCAHLVIPAAIIKTLAASLMVNFTAGMAARGALKKGEAILLPSAA